MRAALRRPQPATVISLIALFVALGGTGYAAVTLNGASIKPNTVSGNRLKANTLTGREIRESKLSTVPKATSATKATTATRATTATKADTATKATTADTATKATTADTATTATTALNANTVGGQPASAFAPSGLITFARQGSTQANGELGRDTTVGLVVNTDAGNADDFQIAFSDLNATDTVSGFIQCNANATVTGFSVTPAIPQTKTACPLDVTTHPSNFTIFGTNITTLRSVRMDCSAVPVAGSPIIFCYTFHLGQ